MKTKTFTQLRITALACLLLWTPLAGWASPPRQHSVTGTIERIDYGTRTIVISPSSKSAPRQFVWKQDTRFKAHGASVSAEVFAPGKTVRLSYRKEIGQMVVREVPLKREPIACCVACR